MKPSTSGISAYSSSAYRSTRQPVTNSFRSLPASLNRAISNTASIDSSFAGPMNPQVLTNMISASAGSLTNS
ncbi:MAG: hypothetical protein BWY81_00235 [Firmicutes bacterium ADurb.Bin467]|nr:MAG: hypothetical protein BWY81_00235 [Firmicutes bacterium ADurb.Bin467]